MFVNRQKLLDNIKKLPSVAIRNLKGEISHPRTAEGFRDYDNKLKYFLAQYSLLSNRSDKFRANIEKKMFKANITIDDLIDFADDKQNMLGGGNVTRNMIKNVVKEDPYDLKIVFDKGNIMVVDVMSPDAIKAIGCNSLWCFTYGSGFDNAYRQWNNYSTNDHVYVIIDFSKGSDDPSFMHVVISPVQPEDGQDEDFEQNAVFNMANEAIYGAEQFIYDTLGGDVNKILNFGEEPEIKQLDKPKPFVDPNQLSLFEIKLLIKKRLFEHFKKKSLYL